MVKARTLALLEPANGLLAQDLWALLESGAEVDDLLEALSATGLRNLGAFAFAQFEADGIRVVVRGSAGVDGMSTEGSQTVRAGAARTWIEDLLPLGSSVTLWLRAPSDDPLPFRVSEGLLPADLLRRAAASDPLLIGTDLSWAHSFDPPAVVGSPNTETEAPLLPEVRPSAIELAIPLPPRPAADADADADADNDHSRTISVNDLTPGLSENLGLPSTGEIAGDAPPSKDEPVDDYDYDALYGRTIARSVQRAAVHASAEEHAAVSSPSPDLGEGVGPPQAVATPISEAGVIDGVPPVSLVEPMRPGDHDGRTITKAQLDAMRSQAGVPGYVAPPMGGPTVQALTCATGHLNPTQAGTCRVCGESLGGAPITVARPSLGRLTFATGEVVVLDRPVIIGRNPRLEGRAFGELPQLLKLDIGHGLSRSHAMVRLEGWQVLIEDLGSANGTVVTLPGRAPRRLHAGEPAMLEAAAEIDFGGEVTAKYDMLP